MVEELFAADKRSWNKELVESVFDPHDVVAILATPISRIGSPDQIAWRFESRDLYILKSAYKAISNVPKKMKVFMWKGCQRALPVHDNLVKRRIVVEEVCFRCHEGVETELHVPSDCPYSREVWTHLGFNWDIGFDDTASLLDRLCSRALPPPRRTQIRNKWAPPPMNFVKVNFDVSLQEQQRCCGIGVVTRNHVGQIVAVGALRMEYVTTAFLAEAIAVMTALEFASDLGFHFIILEGDSLCVVKNLQVNEQNLSSIGPVIEERRFKFVLFHKCCVGHVLRSGNMAAHTVAKYALLSSKESVWIEECHVFLQSVIVSDIVMNEVGFGFKKKKR
ncbi:hypothetical protein REPUB_Repub15cG0108600 [Reevesia pubescens]